MWKRVLLVGSILLFLSGCSMQTNEREKVRDLEYNILKEQEIPADLSRILEEKRQEAFKLTFEEEGALYLCVGYGEQETGGYSIAVDELYLTDDAVHVSTSLLGPDITGQKSGAGKPTTPYIVIKTELLDKTVLYE